MSRYRRGSTMSLYGLVSVVSYIIRTWYMPNPFASCPNGELINYIAGIVLWPISYFTVGLYYRSGSAPIVGSLLYLAFYWGHVMLLTWMGAVGWVWWAVSLIAGGYIGLNVLACRFKERYFRWR